MIPNYNFDNEISSQYELRNRRFKELADKMYNKYKLVKEKEYKCIVWIGCNMTVSSKLRNETLKWMEQVEKERKLEDIKGNQLTIF